jgi:hypothetical protein
MRERMAGKRAAHPVNIRRVPGRQDPARQQSQIYCFVFISHKMEVLNWMVRERTRLI